MQNEIDLAPRRASAAHLKAPKRSAPVPMGQPAAEPALTSIAQLTAPNEPAAPTSPTPKRQSKNAARFDRLKRLRDTLAPNLNRNELAMALIEACLLEGIRGEGDIVRTLYHLGFDNRHAANVLRKSAGSNPRLHRWAKGADGRYRLLS